MNHRNVKAILSLIPKDKQFKGMLEQVRINKKSELIADISVTDGVSITDLTVKLTNRPFAKYKKKFQKIYNQKNSTKICLNRKQLMKILQIMDKTAPDATGEAAVYIEAGKEGILLRSYDPKFKQITSAVMNQYTITDKNWLEYTLYEKFFLKRGR